MSELNINNASIELNSEDLRAIRGQLACLNSILHRIEKYLKLQATTVGICDPNNDDAPKTIQEWADKWRTFSTADKMSGGKSTDFLSPYLPTKKEAKREIYADDVIFDFFNDGNHYPDACSIRRSHKELLASNEPDIYTKIKALFRQYGIKRLIQADGFLTGEERLELDAKLCALEDEFEDSLTYEE